MEEKRNKIGEIMCSLRTKAHIQKNELCSGLCSVKTLERIENGTRRGDKWLIESLFSRMGKSTAQFEFYVSQKEYELQEMRLYIKQTCNSKNIMQTASLLSNYEKETLKANRLHQQFILSVKAGLSVTGDGLGEKISLLEQALAHTMPGFFNKKWNNLYFSGEELYLITLLSNAYEKAGEGGKALKTRKYFYTYLWQEWVDEGIRLTYLPPLADRLADQLFHQKDFLLLQKISKEMEKLLKRNCELFTLPKMMAYLANTRKKEAISSGEQLFCKQELLRASVLSKILKEYDDTDCVSQDILADPVGMTLMARSQSGCHLIGEDIKTRRKAEGMTQQELCVGICSPRALSSIENGKSMPREAVCSQLLWRLGANASFYGKHANASDFSAGRNKYQLKQLIYSGKYKEAGELFEELEEGLADDPQYRMLMKTMLEKYLYHANPEYTRKKI